jgi:hypothetical protein
MSTDKTLPYRFEYLLASASKQRSLGFSKLFIGLFSKSLIFSTSGIEVSLNGSFGPQRTSWVTLIRNEHFAFSYFAFTPSTAFRARPLFWRMQLLPEFLLIPLSRRRDNLGG